MAGGNYGGSSTPTTPISGNNLYAGRYTTYADYKCTAFVAAAATTFTYQGQTVNATTSYVESIISPQGITTDPTVSVTFFCYKCNCSETWMSGTTDENSLYFYTGTTTQFRPVIIGSNGLNS